MHPNQGSDQREAKDVRKYVGKRCPKCCRIRPSVFRLVNAWWYENVGKDAKGDEETYQTGYQYSNGDWGCGLCGWKLGKKVRKA